MVDWTKSVPNPVDDAVAKMKIAVEDLDANPAISSADTAELIDQAARLINSAVVGGALVVPSAGGTGLPVAAGALAPAATPPMPIVDSRVEAAASHVGLTVEQFLAQAADVILGLDRPSSRSSASRGARATAAASAATGFITLSERNEPPGTVLSDGTISSGPAVVPPPVPSGVPQADYDDMVSERDAARTERDTARTERDTARTERDTAVTARDNALTRVTAFEAARTALVAAKGMPQGNRRERADRDTAIQAAVAQLNAV